MNKLLRLLYLVAFYGFIISSPFSVAGAATFLTIGITAAVIDIVSSKKQVVYSNGLLIFVFLYYFAYILANIFSGNFIGSMKSLSREWLPLTLLFWASFKPDEKGLKLGFDMLVAVTGLFSLYAVLQHFSGYDLVRGKALESIGKFYISTGPYGGHLTFGGVYFLICFFILGYLVASELEKGRRFYYYLLFLVISFFAIVFSYARSIWVAMIVSLLLIVYIVARRNFLKIILMFLVFISILTMIIPSIRERISDVFAPSYIPSLNRLTLWETSFNMIRHNPITGLGSGGFIRNFDKYYTGGVCPVRCHPHNDYLNILVESGILGFLVYVGLFLIFFKTAFYTYRIGKDLWKGIALGSIIAITGIMVAGLFECYFVDDEVEELIFFIFGLNSIAYFNVNNPRKILREPIKVLLVRTDRIGDLILSTPVAELLKKYNQLLNIDFLVSEYSSPVLKNNPYVNNVYIKKGFFETIRVIRSVNPRVVIFIRPKLDEAIAGFISGVFLRVGTGYRIYSFLYNLRHYEHRKENLYHEAIYNCHLLRVLGLECVPDRIVFYLSDDDRVSASKILQDLWLKDDFVVLHPGGSGSSLLWSPGKFGELARIFVRMGMRVLVTGTRSEFHIAEEIVDIAGKFSYNLAGKTDLLTLAAIFEKSLIVITNSTGPLHIADSVGAKVLGIFPPTLSMSPSRWGPYNQKENIIVPPVQQCEKCVKDKCKYWFCMDMLKPETVFEKAIEIVKISRG